jgi:hypothetical protein
MRDAGSNPVGARFRVAAGRCAGMCLLVFALSPDAVFAQVQEEQVLARAHLFRTVAMSDSTSPTDHANRDLSTRFLYVDSIVVASDSARVHLTLRDREHVHRETYVLIRRDLVWHVIELKIDRILRLHLPYPRNGSRQE